MAILQRTALYSAERLDLPDARAPEAYVQNDLIYYIKGMLTQKSMIATGFEVTNYANIFTVPGVNLSQNDVSVLHPEATTQAAGFYVSSGTEPDYSLVLSSSNAGLTTNFVEVDFNTTTGSPDVRAFWDQGANGNAGAEYTDTVDTVINLNLSIDVNISGFTTGKIPLYKIVTNPDGTVNSLTDCRNLLYSLGSGGTSPNQSNSYAFPNSPDAAHARFPTPGTAKFATTSNAPFQGGDKNLKSMKNWMDAVMTLIKETNNTPYWTVKPLVSKTGAYQNAALTLLAGGTWEHLGKSAAVVSSTSNSVTVKQGTAFDASADTFTIGSSAFNYTAYDITTGIFSGVTPNPTSAAVAGAIVKQGQFGHLELLNGTNVVRFGQNNSTLLAFSNIDLSVNNTLFVLLSNDGSSVGYTFGQDGATPIAPKAITAVTPSSITVALGGNYITSAGNLMIEGQTFSYTSYNATTGLFTGVSSDPSGLVSVGDIAYQDMSGSTGYYQVATSGNVPGTENGSSQGAERVLWLAYYDGDATIYIHDYQLVPGESANTGTSNDQVYQYIGSSGPSDNFPIYNVHSIPNGTDLTTAITDAYKIIETPIYDEKYPLPLASPITISNINTDNGTALEILNPFKDSHYGPPDQTYLASPFTATQTIVTSEIDVRLYRTTSTDFLAIDSEDNSSTAALNSSVLGNNDQYFVGGIFTANQSGTVDRMRLTFGNTQSTGNYGISLSFYNVDSNGLPTGAPLSGSTTVNAVGNLAVDYYAIGGINFAVTAGTSYAWVAMTTGVPAGQYFTVPIQASNTGRALLTSTDGGTTYTNTPSMSFGKWEVDITSANATAIGNLYAEIRSPDSNNKPGTIIATSSAVAASSVSTTAGLVSFPFPSNPSLSAGNYFVTLRGDSTYQGGPLDIWVSQNNGGGPVYGGTDGTNFPSTFTGTQAIFQVLGTSGTSSSLNSGDIVYLPTNSKTSTPGIYTIGTDELEVFENGILLQKGYDYTEATSTSIQMMRMVLAGSFLRFRIASVGGAGSAAGTSTAGTTLQSAYTNGRTITVVPGQPVTINGSGSSPGKLLSINGDLYVQGNIDPTGITFTPQGSNPLPSGQIGFWVDSTANNINYTKMDGTMVPIGNIIENMNGNTPYFKRTMQNSTMATIPAGSPVYISGSGTIALANCNDPSASIFFGFTMTAIASGASGSVIFAGVVPGILASTGIAANSRLWLTTTPGVLSVNPPTQSGSYQVQVGLACGDDLILQIQDFGQVV